MLSSLGFPFLRLTSSTRLIVIGTISSAYRIGTITLLMKAMSFFEEASIMSCFNRVEKVSIKAGSPRIRSRVVVIKRRIVGSERAGLSKWVGLSETFKKLYRV
jgi:hypothetical protein